MASWMVHLRVADRLLDRLEGIREKEFIMGNIAPDSGVPNADWTAYAPPTEVSHFKTYLGDSRIYENAVGFVNRYMDIFAEDAFENRREYIIGFYRGDRENIEREYIYRLRPRPSSLWRTAWRPCRENWRKWDARKFGFRRETAGGTAISGTFCDPGDGDSGIGKECAGGADDAVP